MKNYASINKQRGQLMILAMFGMIPLVLLIGFVFNTGEQVSSKIRVQNAADSAAMTQATWAARSLNVMSINNTALSQTYSVTVVGFAAAAVAFQAAPLIVKEQAEIAKALANCAQLCTNPIGCAAAAVCAAGPVAREVHLLDEIIPRYRAIAGDIGGGDFASLSPIPTKINEFQEISAALSVMNDEIIARFPEYSKKVSQELATLNGLTDTPRFYAGFNGNDVAKKEKYLTTGLPVKKVELLNGAFKSVLGGTLKGVSERGTQSTTLIKRFHDFEQHGYSRNRGPYKEAYDDTKKAVDKLTGKDVLNKQKVLLVYDGPKEKTPIEFSEIADPCWNFVAILQWLPLKYVGCTPPAPGFRLSVYEVEQDFLTQSIGANFWTNPNDLSILAYVERTRSGGAIFSSRFTSPVGAEFAYAQAEIYNDKHPDLYTQNWRAVLRPSTLLESNKRSEAIAASKDFAELHVFLTSFTQQQHEYLNAH